jgi:hypothetical protein
MNDPRLGTGASHGVHGAPIPHSGPPLLHSGPPGIPHRPGVLPQRAAAPIKPADDRIELVDEVESAPNAPGDPAKARAGAFSAADIGRKEDVFQRQLHTTAAGATRVKSFHGRLSDQGLEYMDHAINEWLDRHPEVDVKFVTSVTGVYEGKIREPALILNVWY